MGKQFDKLPQAWQEEVNKEITDLTGDEHPGIAEAFREHWGKYYQEVELPPTPSINNVEEIGNTLVDFFTGWKAAIVFLRDLVTKNLNQSEDKHSH